MIEYHPISTVTKSPGSRISAMVATKIQWLANTAAISRSKTSLLR